jgi:Predicted membrane protein
MLFIDILDIELMLLGGGLFLIAYWVLLNFTINYDQQKLIEINKGFGFLFLALGIYVLATGLWGTFVWPLQLKASPFKAGMDRKAYKGYFLISYLVISSGKT